MISEEKKNIPALLVPGRNEQIQQKLVSVIEQLGCGYSVCSDIYCLLEKILCCGRSEAMLVVGELSELSRERMRLFDILSKRPAIECICMISNSPSRQQTQQIRTAIRAGALIAGDSRELKKMVSDFIDRCTSAEGGNGADRQVSEKKMSTLKEDLVSPEEISALLGD